MTKANKKIVVILGMYRSGTSAIARGIQVLSLHLGDNLMGPITGYNDKGFWEDNDIYKFNESLLSKLYSSWHSLSQLDVGKLLSAELYLERKEACKLLARKISNAGTFAFKDPRIAILLPFWQQIFGILNLDANYIIVNRNPLQIAESLLKLDGFQHMKSFILWAKHIMAAIRYTQHQRRVFVACDAMFESPHQQLLSISQMLNLKNSNINPVALENYANEFLSLSLRHNVVTEEKLSDTFKVPPFVHDL